MSQVVEDVVQDVKNDINEIKKDILPSSESQPIEEISGTAKKQKSLADKVLSSPYLRRDYEMEQIFNSNADAEYQINNLLNIYKSTQFQLVYTMTAYFIHDNNDIYEAYPLSILNEQLVLYKTKFSEIEQLISKILLRNLISNRQINNLTIGAKIEYMTESEENKLGALADALEGNEIQSGGSSPYGDIYVECLNASYKNIDQFITNVMIDFIKANEIMNHNITILEEATYSPEIISAIDKDLKENIKRGDFSNADKLLNINNDPFVLRTNTVTAIKGGAGDVNEQSVTSSDTGAAGKTVDLPNTVGMKFNQPTDGISYANVKGMLITSTGLDNVDEYSKFAAKHQEDLNKAIKELETDRDRITSFTIKKNDIDNLIIEELSIFSSNYFKNMEQNKKKDQNIEEDTERETEKHLNKFHGSFSKVHRNIIFKGILNNSDTDTINNELLAKYGGEGKTIDNLTTGQYEIFKGLSILFESEINDNLKSIAKSSDDSIKTLLNTIIHNNNQLIDNLFESLGDMLLSPLSDKNEDMLIKIIEPITQASKDLIDKSTNKNKEELKKIINKHPSQLTKLANDMYMLQHIDATEPGDLSNMKVVPSIGQGQVVTQRQGQNPTSSSVIENKNDISVTSLTENQLGDYNSIMKNPEYQTNSYKEMYAKYQKKSHDKTDIATNIETLKKENEVSISNLDQTNSWLTQDQVKKLSSSIDTHINNNIIPQLVKDKVITYEQKSTWSDMLKKSENTKLKVPENSSNETKQIINMLNNMINPTVTTYDNIIITLTKTGVLASGWDTTGTYYDADTLGKAVKEGKLSTSSSMIAFGAYAERDVPKDSDQEKYNNNLDAMRVEEWNTNTYKNASPQNQIKWINENWNNIKEEHDNALKETQSNKPGDSSEYDNTLKKAFTAIAKSAILTKKHEDIIGEMVVMEDVNLPKLLTQSVLEFQDKTLSVKRDLLKTISENFVDTFKDLRSALMPSTSSMSIELKETVDEDNQIQYEFTSKINENAITSLMKIVSSTENLLELKLSLLEMIRTEVDDENAEKTIAARWWSNLPSLRSKNFADVKSTINEQIDVVNRSLVGSKTGKLAMKNFNTELIDGLHSEINNKAPQQRLDVILNLNTTIPRLNSMIEESYKTGKMPGQMSMKNTHGIMNPNIAWDMFRTIPDGIGFTASQVKELWSNVQKMMAAWKLPIMGAVISGGAVGVGMITNSPVAHAAVTGLNYVPPLLAKGISGAGYYMLADAAIGTVNSWIGKAPIGMGYVSGKAIRDYGGMTRKYNQALYDAASVANYLNMYEFPSINTMDANQYMGIMNNITLTQDLGNKYWNTIPNTRLPPSSSQEYEYITTGAFTLNDNVYKDSNFIGSPLPNGSEGPDGSHEGLGDTGTTPRPKGGPSILFAENNKMGVIENTFEGVTGAAILTGLYFIKTQIMKSAKTERQRDQEQKEQERKKKEQKEIKGQVDKQTELFGKRDGNVVYNVWTTTKRWASWTPDITEDSVKKELKNIDSNNNECIEKYNSNNNNNNNKKLSELKNKLKLTTLSLIKIALLQKIANINDKHENETEKYGKSKEVQQHMKNVAENTLYKVDSMFRYNKTYGDGEQNYGMEYFAKNLIKSIQTDDDINKNIMNRKLKSLLESYTDENNMAFEKIYVITTDELKKRIPDDEDDDDEDDNNSDPAPDITNIGTDLYNQGTAPTTDTTGDNISNPATAPGCKYKDIPDAEKSEESFVGKTPDERNTFVTKYFQYMNNVNCVTDARNKLVSYLKALYNNNGDSSIDEIGKLKSIYEIGIPTRTLSETQRNDYPIAMNVIKGEVAFTAPVLSEEEQKKNKEEQAKREENMITELRELCEKNPKLPEETQKTKTDISDIATDVKNNNSESKLFTENNLEFTTDDNVNYYHVETTSDGECMYSSFIFSMFYKGIGNWYGKGWVPAKKELDGGKINYMGNLRSVLANYICINLDDLVKSQTVSIIQLLEAMKRIQENEWGQDTEIILLAKMFDICVGVFKQVEGVTRENTFELYNSKGINIQNDSGTEDNRPEQIKKNCVVDNKENILYILEIRNRGIESGGHFQALIGAPAAKQPKVQYMSVKSNKDASKTNINYDNIMNKLLGNRNDVQKSKSRGGIIKDLQELEGKFGTSIRKDKRSIEDIVKDSNYTKQKALNDIQSLLKDLRDNENDKVKDATKMQTGGLLKKNGSKKKKVEKKKGRKTKRKTYTKKKKGNSKKHKKKTKVKRNTRRN